MDEELDLVTFSDEDGNEFTMEVLDYFFYEGKEYALLAEVEDDCECDGVEDAVAGVQAIKDAGMVAVAVGDANELAKADKVVPTTADFSYDLFEETFEKANA